MNNKEKFLYIIILLTVVIFTNVISIKLAMIFTSSQEDKDYQKLELEIEDYDIDCYTVYSNDASYEYKVYKINGSYKGDSMDEIKAQIENSNSWSREKFYEYIMIKFYERTDGKTTEIDRENLYYYNKGLIYAIIDAKNAKLYYLKNNIIDYHNDYNEILGINLDNYIEREIYNVKGQEAQNDGIDYYTYRFNEEKGKDIETTLSNSENWSQEKPDAKILESFEYNSEVLDIQNGYYHYQKICRTSDDYEKEHFTDEEATGYEVGVYDCDKHILYYYWTSI